MDEQERLLKIVQTWNISPQPEYRGFRCANCQQYKNQAWYHWLKSGNFLVPVHLCEDTCESEFKEGSLSPTNPPVAPAILTNPYSDKARGSFEEIIEEWNTNIPASIHAFICDSCEKELDIDPTDNMRKGWHVWYQMKNGNLAELHFHRQCYNSLV
jgi:hypothetical protein